jgi:hypothetical protein
MSTGDRKSSEDLIREANERLRSSAEDRGSSVGDTPQPSPGGHPLRSEASTQPSDQEPAPPQGLQYRSQSSPVPDEEPLDVEPEDQDSDGGGWASSGVVRWVAIALLFAGGYFFSTFGDADRDSTGEIVSGGDLDVMSLQVGDCFDDPADLEDVVFEVIAVPCIEPHDNEVYSVQSLATAFPRAFPGQDALWDYSYQVCRGSVFDSFVGTPYAQSVLEVFSLTPSEESWEDGDREFVCALFRLDGEKLSGTARGSGL